MQLLARQIGGSWSQAWQNGLILKAKPNRDWNHVLSNQGVREINQRKLLKLAIACKPARAGPPKPADRAVKLRPASGLVEPSTVVVTFATAQPQAQHRRQCNDGDCETLTVQRMSVMILRLPPAHKVEHLVVSGVPETMAARSLIEGLIQPHASTHRFKLDIKMGLQPARLAHLAAGQIDAALRYSAADSVATFEVSLPC